ncbi:hypothetical protein RUND412_009468 [Rhizina undulata]
MAATSIPPITFKNGFKEPSSGTPWIQETQPGDDEPSYVPPPSLELLTSTHHNSLGINVLRTWPTLENGTNNPHGLPEWFKKEKEVDVLICGAGPSGLEIALSLLRQGVTFRIVDKAPTPLISGRADALQPRYLETLHHWGLAKEVLDEGPLLNYTTIYKDGQKILFKQAWNSDSRYRGLSITTQGQVERIFIRDLLRHQKVIERSTTVKNFSVEPEKAGETHPVKATLINEKTGEEETIKAKFLVGADGARSQIRKSCNIPFEGTSTNLYWGIIDCVWETDFPHAWTFGLVLNSEHGGCVLVPREDGHTRIYTQLDTSFTGPLGQARQNNDATFAEIGGGINVHSITPDEVLEQTNRIFAPYKLKFASPVSWFSIWKISERVAREFSAHHNRVHLVGDAAHIHSVMGAFGLNISLLDAANLGWKLGLSAQGLADPAILLPTYSLERRRHAVRIIETSGSYLRFVCNSNLDVLKLDGPGTEARDDAFDEPTSEFDPGAGEPNPDLQFMKRFYYKNANFLLGIDNPYGNTVLNPPRTCVRSLQASEIKNGVRAPNPRVCFGLTKCGYLYDKFGTASQFNLVVFGSDLSGPIRRRLATLANSLKADSHSFYNRFGGAERFKVVLVTKCLPLDTERKLLSDEDGHDLSIFLNPKVATVVYDDRAPDEDAHLQYGVNHANGAVIVIRPDLWMGISTWADGLEKLDKYFEGFLLPVEAPKNVKSNGTNGHKNGNSNGYSNGIATAHTNGKANGKLNGFY